MLRYKIRYFNTEKKQMGHIYINKKNIKDLAKSLNAMKRHPYWMSRRIVNIIIVTLDDVVIDRVHLMAKEIVSQVFIVSLKQRLLEYVAERERHLSSKRKHTARERIVKIFNSWE